MPASIELSAPCPRCAPYGRLSAPHYPLRLAAACHRIWLVRTRQVTASARDPALQFWHHGPAGWTPASRAHFLADQDPSLPTVFWVHGNRVSDSGAVNVGMGIGRLLAEHARVPFRFVIWSWPSERICGPLRDVREKAARSDEGAYPLASLIDQIDPAVPISLVGYSYGSRLITGALQLLGGGQLACRCLPYRHNALRVPLRAVLIAGSLDNNALQPGQRTGQALTQVDQMLVVVNVHDPALKWYHLMCGVAAPRAMGHTGVDGVSSPSIWHLDLSEPLGCVHDLDKYLAQPSLIGWLATQALFFQ